MTTEEFKPTASISPARFYCGIDIHKRELAVSILGRDDSDAKYVKSNVFLATLAGLKSLWQFVSTFEPIGFVMEATGIYHHTVAQFLEQMRAQASFKFEILIVNPADAKGIPGHQKCDRLDAEMLARYYAAGLLQGGKQIFEVLEDLKALFRMELRLEKERTALKNRIKKTLDRAGFRPTKLDFNYDWVKTTLFALSTFKGSIEDFVKEAINPESQLIKCKASLTKALPLWEPYYNVSLSGGQKALIRQDLFDLDLKTSRKTLLRVEMEKTLLDRIVLRDLAHRIASIPGMSIHSAIWFLAEIGSVERFHSVREFQAYCGCIPRTVSSADKVYSAHISRHSNKYLRLILYQAARVVCVSVKQNSGLKEYANRMLAKKEHSPIVAYCTVSAKIARIIYAVIQHNTIFLPELAQNKKIPLRPLVPKQMSLVDQKDLLKAKRALYRIQTMKALQVVGTEMATLIQSLEEILAKK
jgi:transposase